MKLLSALCVILVALLATLSFTSSQQRKGDYFQIDFCQDPILHAINKTALHNCLTVSCNRHNNKTIIFSCKTPECETKNNEPVKYVQDLAKSYPECCPRCP